MALITEYKCPGCGAPLAFDAESGQVKCSSCGNEYEVKDVVEAQGEAPSTSEFDWGDYKSTLSTESLGEMDVYKCVSCGAEIEADSNTVATTCPYCGNNVVLTDRVAGGLKPNCIIPFEITKKQVPELIKKFYQDKPLLPDNFFTENQMEKIQGVYVPFWLFDCSVSGEVRFNATRVTTAVVGKNLITTTSFYLIKRGGNMEFSLVPADASTKMDNDLMDSLEPYDYSKLVPFESAYLTGYVADRFDSDPDAELPRLTERTINSSYQQARDTVVGYETVTERSNSLSVDKAAVKYALLPAYILNCKYNGQSYRYAINGQTGKVVGELPIDKGKSFKKFLKGFLITFVVTGGLAALITWLAL